MEDLDQRILKLLAADGRMSFTDLGKATGLSTSAVHQRVKRLESRGLIKGYGATIDYELGIKPYGVKEFGVRDLDELVIAFGQLLHVRTGAT